MPLLILVRDHTRLTRLRLLSGNWRNLVDLFRIRFGASRSAATVPLPEAREGRRAA